MHSSSYYTIVSVHALDDWITRLAIIPINSVNAILFYTYNIGHLNLQCINQCRVAWQIIRFSFRWKCISFRWKKCMACQVYMQSETETGILGDKNASYKNLLRSDAPFVTCSCPVPFECECPSLITWMHIIIFVLHIHIF
jgi:hypothetical protein